MQLKLTRSKRNTWFGKTIFHLDVRAQLTGAERQLVRKYKLGREIIYSSESLTQLASGAAKQMDISSALSEFPGASFIASLKGAALGVASRFALKITTKDLLRGKAIECKDLMEMLNAEQAVITACQNLKSYIEQAETFDGREFVFEV